MNRIRGLLLVLAAAAVPATATAQTLTFEELRPNVAHIPDGYGGLMWSQNFWSTDETPFLGDPNHYNGFITGLQSGTMVATSYGMGSFFPVSFSSVSPFTFNSIWVTPAFRLGETVTVQGWNGFTEVYSASFLADWNAPYFFEPNWSNLTKVDFYGSGGASPFVVEHPTWVGPHLVFDDLNVSVTPEPATLLLLGTGMIGVVGAAWRRRKHDA